MGSALIEVVALPGGAVVGFSGPVSGKAVDANRISKAKRLEFPITAAAEQLNKSGSKNRGPQSSGLPDNGGRRRPRSEPLRKIWSRRRQSTSVNGVCQALTTISGILDGILGIKVHNSRISVVENGGKPRPERVWVAPGRLGRAARHIAPADLRNEVPCQNRGYARGFETARRGNGAISVDECGSCGEGVR